MATTATPVPETETETSAARASVPSPTPPAAGRPGPEPISTPPVTGPETSTSLFGPPDYDNIVGGVPPSPYASTLLLAGIICLVVGAVGMAIGADMSQWWILGGILAILAIFLAGFVSRGA